MPGVSSPIPIPFPLSSAPGVIPQESAGRLLNAYAEPMGKTAQSGAVYRRVPGLDAWGTTIRSGFRGGIQIGPYVYTAWDSNLERHVITGGASTHVGTLNGTAKGFFARNNKSGTPDQVFCDPDGNVATFTSSSVTNGYPDVDLPTPNSVTSIDGYLVFSIADGRAFATALNDTAVDPLSFGTAEFKPDGLVRAITLIDKLVLMGNYTTEIWADVGAVPFPFQRATTLTRGLIGPYAVAGTEDYFSKQMLWVADDLTVVALDGYTTTKVSTPDVDRAIEDCPDRTKLEATAYMAGGHAFWELTCPTMFTWVFDMTTRQWHERAAYLDVRSRIAGAIPAFGKWLTGDSASGNVLEIKHDATSDNGASLPAMIESGPVRSFPNRMRIARADFDFSVGIGSATGVDPIQTDPTVEISCSLDGGRTWGIPSLRKLGRQAKGDTRISVRNLGQSGPYGPRFRLVVSDPIYVGFMGGTINKDIRQP